MACSSTELKQKYCLSYLTFWFKLLSLTKIYNFLLITMCVLVVCVHDFVFECLWVSCFFCGSMTFCGSMCIFACVYGYFVWISLVLVFVCVCLCVGVCGCVWVDLDLMSYTFCSGNFTPSLLALPSQQRHRPTEAANSSSVQQICETGLSTKTWCSTWYWMSHYWMGKNKKSWKITLPATGGKK